MQSGSALVTTPCLVVIDALAALDPIQDLRDVVVVHRNSEPKDRLPDHFRCSVSEDALQARVRRDGDWVTVPAAELVLGDIVQLSLGSVVPADGRIVAGSLLLDQSMLTGESIPAEAETGKIAYAGALVRRGEATAEIVATGAGTYFGRAAELVRIAHVESSEQRACSGSCAT